MLTSPSKPKSQRRVIGDDQNNGVRITARVTTDTEIPLRWFERGDGTFVLEFLTTNGWREVPLIEK